MGLGIGPFAIHHVQISAASAASLVRDEDLGGARLWNWQIAHDEAVLGRSKAMARIFGTKDAPKLGC